MGPATKRVTDSWEPTSKLLKPAGQRVGDGLGRGIGRLVGERVGFDTDPYEKRAEHLASPPLRKRGGPSTSRNIHVTEQGVDALAGLISGGLRRA